MKYETDSFLRSLADLLEEIYINEPEKKELKLISPSGEQLKVKKYKHKIKADLTLGN
jgi:hypothetical protein